MAKKQMNFRVAEDIIQKMDSLVEFFDSKSKWGSGVYSRTDILQIAVNELYKKEIDSKRG